MNQLIRIEKGSPDPDELAALTAVVLALASARAEAAEATEAPHEHRPAGRPPVRWRRRERHVIPGTGHGWRGGGAAR
ncbi:acyl-CoA carboxylase subunit epsilon [Streptomyces sp. NBC_01351]|uniref:acyl-CoA carboxylase subunit epsilon n=1 Tax=Streptomyces sp. NBC_01351 TaxID=2903833 RepID=UPI002E371F88|nr:acyl-CoA carboxylase subunit epsilon [Streptomyces sp. NBC_01351]